MRVITGSARGRRLKELEGMETRPTTDKVKEGMFSIIQFDIEGRRALDLFAGTGQLGIEALSRGAAECVFVDRRADAVELIRENVKLCALEENARIRKGDALTYLRSGEKFDLVFLDPPYATDLLDQALEAITGFDICRAHGIIIAESAADHVLPAVQPPYRLYREYRYGKIKLTVYHRSGNEDEE
ncbi:MAG: 16S rRNA (guanine(966)-N(2))-methyltransferase RsmD [Oscillospiraceae bacterium]|nr:16S rRNA (guanine(966)-N(2))-methyltransferase RsmD [Oscillospiraceae bacterium]